MQNVDGSSCRSLPESLLGIFFSFCPSLSHEAQSSRQLLYRQTYDSSANVGVFEKQNRAGAKHCLCCPKSVQTAAACLRPASRPQALPPPPQEYARASASAQRVSRGQRPAHAGEGDSKYTNHKRPHIKKNIKPTQDMQGRSCI